MIRASGNKGSRWPLGLQINICAVRCCNERAYSYAQKDTRHLPLPRPCVLMGYVGVVHLWDSGTRGMPRFFARASSKECDFTLPGTLPAAHLDTVDWSASIEIAISACESPLATKRLITSVALKNLCFMH